MCTVTSGREPHLLNRSRMKPRKKKRTRITKTRRNSASTLTEIYHSKGVPLPIRSDRCDNCGARPTSSQISVWEISANAVCGGLLLAVMLLARYDTYQLID